jgi:hypothetical protein
MKKSKTESKPSFKGLVKKLEKTESKKKGRPSQRVLPKEAYWQIIRHLAVLLSSAELDFEFASKDPIFSSLLQGLENLEATLEKKSLDQQAKEADSYNFNEVKSLVPHIKDYFYSKTNEEKTISESIRNWCEVNGVDFQKLKNNLDNLGKTISPEKIKNNYVAFTCLCLRFDDKFDGSSSNSKLLKDRFRKRAKYITDTSPKLIAQNILSNLVGFDLKQAKSIESALESMGHKFEFLPSDYVSILN